MADFKIADGKTAGFEGGFQIMPEDGGNWTGGKKNVGTLVGTKYGISAPTLKAYLKREPTELEMRNLPLATAQEIRRFKYWVPIKGDLIIDQEQANQIYDMAINAGVSAAVKIAERALGLPETGKMTQQIIDMLNNKV